MWTVFKVVCDVYIYTSIKKLKFEEKVGTAVAKSTKTRVVVMEN